MMLLSEPVPLVMLRDEVAEGVGEIESAGLCEGEKISYGCVGKSLPLIHASMYVSIMLSDML